MKSNKLPRFLRLSAIQPLIFKGLGLLVVNLLVLISFSPVLAEDSLQAQSSAKITILPIDKARMLAGSKFDFRVEVNGAKPDSMEITINGQPAASVFQGVKEETSNAKADKSGEITYRGVNLNTPGKTTVQVKAKVGGQEVTKAVNWDIIKVGSGRAKNVILFIADGLSFPTITATRIVSRGIAEGKYNSFLEMDRMQYRGAVTTSGYDALVTDSANSASAYATGHKAVVNAMGTYEDNTTDAFDDPKVENFIELAKRGRKMATGLVTTADITDATPAAFAAHTRRRSESAFIANTYLDPSHQPDVLMGGGSKWFLPKAKQGASQDDKDLVETFKSGGYAIATSKTELKAVPASSQKMLGLFHTGTMNVYLDREVIKDANTLGNFKDQPTLIDMTDTAIKALSQNPNGFFLMVEGASIDKQLHPMDWQRAVYDTIEMDKALGVAKKFQEQNPDTLIVLVADHSHSLSITGTYGEEDGKKGVDAIGTYEKSKFPTFTYSKNDGFPDDPNPSRTLAIGWGNHPEYFFNPGAYYKTPVGPAIEDPNNKGKYIADPKRGDQGVKMPGNLPADSSTEVHTADDVPLMASGPGAEIANGVLDNTDVFFMMANALGLDPTAANGRSSANSVTGGTIGDPTNPLTRQGGAGAGATSGSTTATGAGAASGANAASTSSGSAASAGQAPGALPASGSGGIQNSNSELPVAAWLMLGVLGLAVAFGGGLFTARWMLRKQN